MYITTISIDITNIQQEYLKLEYAKRKIEESDRLKALFLSNINHEVRTQLNTIVGFSELLHETNYIKDKVKYKDIITKNADSLLRIVDNITELTKLESDSVSLEMSWFEINDLLVSLNNRYKFNDSIRFEIIAPYPDMKIFSDKDCLIHIIDNLLNNSYKFTSEGEIKFGFNIKERGICFYVIDSGIGVSGELQDKVFDKFVKIDTESNGLGLGLYI